MRFSDGGQRNRIDYRREAVVDGNVDWQAPPAADYLRNQSGQGVSTLSRSLEVQMRRDVIYSPQPFDCDLADPFAAHEQKRADPPRRVFICTSLRADNVPGGMFPKLIQKYDIYSRVYCKDYI